MASCVLSIEHVEITITSTNTTGTADITLDQDSANCILLTSFKSATGASTINTRLPEVYFSDSNTITAERHTGTDIGTITIMVEVIEFDPDQCLVQQGTFSVGSGSTSNTATLGSAVSDLTAAFAVINARCSYSSTNYARNAFCRCTFTDTSTLTFTRDASSGTITGRYFVVEALSGEFTVQHGTIGLSNSAEVNDDPLPDNVDLARTALFVSMLNGHTADDWRTTGVRARLEVVSTASSVILSRANGGAASAQAVTCDFQAVTFAQDETVQRGSLTITGTSDTDTLGTAVDMSISTVHSPMTYGLGEGDSTDGTLVGGWFAHIELTASTTVTGTVVDDITPDGVYGYEVIDWGIESGGSALTRDEDEVADVTETTAIDRASSYSEDVDAIERTAIDRASSYSEDVDATERAALDRVSFFTEIARAVETKALDLAFTRATEVANVTETSAVESGEQRDATEVARATESAVFDRVFSFTEFIDVAESSSPALNPSSSSLRLSAANGRFAGLTTVSSGTSVTVDLPASVDISRSILHFSYRGGMTNPSSSSVRGRFLSSSQLIFEWASATVDNIDIAWQVHQFQAGLTAQHYAVNAITHLSTQLLTTTVDLSKTFIIPLGVRKSGSGFTSDDTVLIYFDDSDHVKFEFMGSPAPTDMDVSFIVVTIDDCSVQYVREGMSADVATQVLATIPTAVDPASTIVYATSSNTSSAVLNFDDLLWTVGLNSGTELRFDRRGNTALTIEFAAFVVEFTGGAATVQRGTRAILTSDTNLNFDITPIADVDASLVHAGGTANGWPTMNTTYNVNSSQYNNTFAQLTFVDEDTLNFRRDSGSSSSGDLYWWVAEFLFGDVGDSLEFFETETANVTESHSAFKGKQADHSETARVAETISIVFGKSINTTENVRCVEAYTVFLGGSPNFTEVGRATESTAISRVMFFTERVTPIENIDIDLSGVVHHVRDLTEDVNVSEWYERERVITTGPTYHVLITETVDQAAAMIRTLSTEAVNVTEGTAEVITPLVRSDDDFVDVTETFSVEFTDNPEGSDLSFSEIARATETRLVERTRDLGTERISATEASTVFKGFEVSVLEAVSVAESQEVPYFSPVERVRVAETLTQQLTAITSGVVRLRGVSGTIQIRGESA